MVQEFPILWSLEELPIMVTAQSPGFSASAGIAHERPNRSMSGMRPSVTY